MLAKIKKTKKPVFYSKAKTIGTTFFSLIGLSRNLRKKYGSITSTAEILRTHYKPKPIMTMTLDLGCGSNPRNPFEASKVFGVDIRGDLEGNVKQADLSAAPIPFDDNMFDFCTAFDFIEHIPRSSWHQGKPRLAFIELMNEIHRVLKPNGMLLHSTPAFPSKEAFQDPTHVNIITEDTMPYYFCEPHNRAKCLGYGFNGSFELIAQSWLEDNQLVGIMKAIK